MQVRLCPHPDSRCTAVDRLDARVRLDSEGMLQLRYELAGVLTELRVPDSAPARRADELWRHTCFEAFIGEFASPEYVEVNLSPSTEWAAYRFDAYRTGMRAVEMPAPTIEVRRAATTLELTASLRLPAPRARLRLGLAAVIEDAAGLLSYWALTHPRGKPDFHDAASRTLAVVDHSVEYSPP